MRRHGEGGALLSLSEQSEGGPRDAISRWSNELWLNQRVGRDNKICCYFSESFWPGILILKIITNQDLTTF